MIGKALLTISYAFSHSLRSPPHTLGGALGKALMTHKDRNPTRLWSPTRLQYPVDLGTVRVCGCEAEK